MANACADPSLADDMVELGLHHEQQHQELILTDIKHAFFSNPLLPAYRGERRPKRHEADPLDYAAMPAASSQIGHARPGFAFDNERRGMRCCCIPSASLRGLSAMPNTMSFIDDGGYRRAGILAVGWLGAGCRTKIGKRPLYWLKDGDGSAAKCLHPVRRAAARSACAVEHVSFLRSRRLCHLGRASGLPTEFEWEARRRTFAHGEVWEWTRSSYDPYPGFRPFDGRRRGI